MRFTRIGVVAALAVVVMAPVAVMAAKKPAPAAAAATPGGIDAKARETGMADVPALLASAGLTCNVTDARLIGEDAKTGVKAYEVACDTGFGGSLLVTKDQPKPQMFSCLQTSEPQPDGKPHSLACLLPANAEPLKALAPLIAKAGNSCVVDKVRSIGTNASNTFMEVRCQSGSGFVMQASNPMDPAKEVRMTPCIAYPADNNLACKLTDSTAALAVVDTLVAGAGKSCTPKDKRFVLTTAEGATWYEVACQDGKGYMLEQASTGALSRTVDCAAASFVGGGCTLTDSVAAQTQQAGLYTGLVKKAGFDCNIEFYAPLGIPKELQSKFAEAIELKCTNRPDGAIALFPASGQPAIFNCAAAEGLGYRCTKTKGSDALVQINRDIAGASDKPFACKAYTTGGLAQTETDVLLEVGCDPEGRFAMAYSKTTGKPVGARTCASMGDKCKLPVKR